MDLHPIPVAPLRPRSRAGHENLDILKPDQAVLTDRHACYHFDYR